MSNPYDRWSDTLKYAHDHIRHAIGDIAQRLQATQLGISCSDKPPESPQLTLQQLEALHRTILEVMRDLTMHHTLEDQRCFPLLSKKIPEFKELGEQHHLLETIIAQLTGLARLPVDNATDLSGHVLNLQESVIHLQLLALPHMEAEQELTLPDKTRLLFTEQEMGRLLG